MKNKLIPLLAFVAITLGAQAATRTFSNTTGDGLWSTPENWSGNTLPSAGDTALINTNNAATLTNISPDFQAIDVGRGGVGTGSLTIDGGSLYVTSAASSELRVASSNDNNTVAGAGTLSLVNNAYAAASIMILGRGVANKPDNVNYTAWVSVDKTSSVSATVALEIGRRYGKANLILEGDATQGAFLEAGRLTMSTDQGTGSLSIGMNAHMIVSTVSTLSAGSTVNITGGTLSLGFGDATSRTSISTSTLTVNGGLLTVGNNLLVSGSVIDVKNNATLSTSGPFSVTGTTINIKDSTFNLGGTFTLSDATSSINFDGATVASSALFYQNYSAGSTWKNSDITLGAWFNRFAAAVTTLSGTHVTLTSASQIDFSATDSTSFVNLKDASSLVVDSSSKFLTGRLRLGFSGGTSTFSSNGDILIGREMAIGYASGSGVATILGGTVTFTAGQGTELRVGTGGSGKLTVADTGLVLGLRNMIVGADGDFNGTVYVGTLPTGSLASSYVSAQNLSLSSGALLTGTVNILSDAQFGLVLGGSAASLRAISVGDLSIDTGVAVTIDFTNLTLSGSMELTLLLADTLVGLDIAKIATTGLADGYSVDYRVDAMGSQQALIAALTNIPEPALAAVLIGLAGMAVVVRRRRA